MPLSMQQVQKLSQRLVMTPQMQQSLKLLQMNTIELEELTQQELLENPFLEIEEDNEERGEEPRDGRQEGVLESIADESDREESVSESNDEGDLDAVGDLSEGIETGDMEERPEQFEEIDLDVNETYDDDSDADSGKQLEEEDWAEIFNTTGPRSYRPPAPDDSDERSFEETVAGQSSLYEKLDWQLRVSALSGEDFEIARFLIGSIDDRGYLQTRSTIAECADRNKTSEETIEEILAILEAEGPGGSDGQALIDFVHERWTGKDERIGEDLAGLLAMQRRRPGITIIQRMPTIDACCREFGVKRSKVLEILEIIQEFDPSGVGARDLPECLCIQLQAQGRMTKHTEVILRKHWDSLLKRQFKKIARAVKCDEVEVSNLFSQIKFLDPSPGLHYTKEQPVYISPDVYVREVDGEYRVYMDEGEVANLRLSKTYKDILLNEDDPNQTDEEREYAIEKYRAAVQFIKNVEKRRSTVVRVTEAIMDYQRDFLANGVESLRPLSLSEIAEVVGMHESTISRVTSGKYVDTPQGLFELKYFFSSAISSSEGEAASSRSIKSKIREIIDNENPKKPLSDEKIAKQLKAEGFSIARRTVAKYREQLKILPTNLRRHKE